MEEYKLYRGLFAGHCKSLRFSLSDTVKQLEGFELRDNMMLVKFLKNCPICYVENRLYDDKTRN